MRAKGQFVVQKTRKNCDIALDYGRNGSVLFIVFLLYYVALGRLLVINYGMLGSSSLFLGAHLFS